jgi:methyltransferase-like protein
MSAQTVRTSYDELPYPSHPFPQTHPDRLATIATLFGMKPAPADHCHVLELGCASGGNLIPMALSLPESTFMGIDLSGAQIAEGLKAIAALGLKNIRLRQMSILDVDDGFGRFDYVICHGVYSWVPAEVQEKILDICSRHLAPDGVGYVSYNTYPGWHMRGMIRAMLGLHDKRFRTQPPLVRVGRARALLSFLTNSVSEQTSYGQLLRETVELLQKCTDSYLFHEHLEECNAPIYFSAFCERLAAHQLRYLGETEFHPMVASASFSPAVQKELSQLAPSFLEMEQYMDLLRNRMFRQTLLCHENIRPNYDLRSKELARFHIASPAKPKSETPNYREAGPEAFAARDRLVMTSSTPIVKAALTCLGEIWPQAMAFDQLLANARTRLGTPEHAAGNEEDAQVLAKALLSAHASAGQEFVELRLRPPVFTAQVNECPLASPLARLQAETGPHVTNLRHEIVSLNPVGRHLLPLLDGTHDHKALLGGLVERFQQRAFHLSRHDEPITDAAQAREVLKQFLDHQLPELAKAALLIA